MPDKRWRITKGVYYGYSDAYRWLRLHHAEIEAFLKAKCGPFKYVLTQILKEGIKTTKGQDFDYHTLHDVWRRVRRDIARDAGRVATTVPATPAPPPLPATQASPLSSPRAVPQAPSLNDLTLSAQEPDQGASDVRSIPEDALDPPIFGPLTVRSENLPTRRKRRRLTDEEFRVKIDRVRQDFRDDDKFLHGF